MLFVLTHVFSDFNEKFRGISLLKFLGNDAANLVGVEQLRAICNTR